MGGGGEKVVVVMAVAVSNRQVVPVAAEVGEKVVDSVEAMEEAAKAAVTGAGVKEVAWVAVAREEARGGGGEGGGAGGGDGGGGEGGGDGGGEGGGDGGGGERWR